MRCVEAPHEGKVQVGKVEMDDVELVGSTSDLFEHENVRGEVVPAAAAETQGGGPWRYQLRRGGRIACGEQGHMVAAAYELIRQPCHNPLGASVQPGRDTLR
jgi:hypothetical protein